MPLYCPLKRASTLPPGRNVCGNIHLNPMKYVKVGSLQCLAAFALTPAVGTVPGHGEIYPLSDIKDDFRKRGQGPNDTMDCTRWYITPEGQISERSARATPGPFVDHDIPGMNLHNWPHRREKNAFPLQSFVLNLSSTGSFRYDYIAKYDYRR